MSAAFEEEEEELDYRSRRSASSRPNTHDRELTLSSSTLLAIFFGLVLVCGLFFALGYTLGRRAPADAAQSSAGPAAPASSLFGSSQAKPSAAQGGKAPAPAPPAATTDPTLSDASAPISPEAASGSAPVEEKAVSHSLAPPPVTSQPQPQSPLVKTSAKLNLTPVATPAPTTVAPVQNGYMVQIAAVSNPADADVLVGALRKRGYSVLVRHDAGDPLMHVQVGPFTARADASAMRQKLLADGYNAILK